MLKKAIFLFCPVFNICRDILLTCPLPSSFQGEHFMKKQELINPWLLRNVKKLVESTREAYKSINLLTLETIFEIGKLIVEEEQNGNQRANYGDELLVGLAKELTKVYGRGFSKSNLFLMRQFYLTYKKFQSLTGKSGKCQSLTGKFKNHQKLDKNHQKQHLKLENLGEKCQTLSGKFSINQIISGELSSTNDAFFCKQYLRFYI